MCTVWQRLRLVKLATPNIGTVTDQICCPGDDYCSLANATFRWWSELDGVEVLHELNSYGFRDVDWSVRQTASGPRIDSIGSSESR